MDILHQRHYGCAGKASRPEKPLAGESPAYRRLFLRRSGNFLGQQQLQAFEPRPSRTWEKSK